MIGGRPTSLAEWDVAGNVSIVAHQQYLSATTQETLSELQRRDAHWETNKRRYLEDTSAAGVTPLVLAAQRGNLQCVEVVG